MRTKQNTKKSLLRAAGTLISLFALLSLSGFSLGGTVSADPPNTVLATVKYCKSKMPNNLDKLCTEGNMNRLRAAYKDDCTGKNSDSCIENKSESGINQIAKKNPKNAGDFNDALNAVIKAAGGGGGGGGGGAAGGGGSVPTTITTSDISTSGLPTVDASTQTVKNILQIAFGIIGAFALLSITASGLKYITSAGNEQRTSEAKNGIVYSLVGLLVAISAEAIVSFVVHGVSG